MARFQLLVCMFCFCMFCYGCTPPEIVRIYNNTENPINVLSIAGKNERMFLIRPNESVDFNVGVLLESDFVELRSIHETVCYELIGPNKQFSIVQRIWPFLQNDS